MPLSEQEQRLLDEMERHLMRNDADVVSAPRDGQSLSYRNIVYGSVLVLVGLAALVVGVSTSLIVVGVIAFLIMVGGVVLAVTPARGAAARSPCGRRVIHGPYERPLGSPPRRPLIGVPLRTTLQAPTFGSVLFLCLRPRWNVRSEAFRRGRGSATAHRAQKSIGKWRKVE